MASMAMLNNQRVIIVFRCISMYLILFNRVLYFEILGALSDDITRWLAESPLDS